MSEPYTYFEGLKNLLAAVGELEEKKLKPFMKLALPRTVLKQAGALFIDLKCDILLSQKTTRVLDRWPYETLKRRFRELESYIGEATQFEWKKTVSGKDAAAGEKEEERETWLNL